MVKQEVKIQNCVYTKCDTFPLDSIIAGIFMNWEKVAFGRSWLEQSSTNWRVGGLTPGQGGAHAECPWTKH